MIAADREAIDLELQRLLSLGRHRPGRRPVTDHDQLWTAFERAVDGGKRFRPALLVAVHRAFGGARPEAAIRAGAAVELLHTAFMIQDDVIDGDQMRRGVPSVSGGFTSRARESGVPQAGSRRFGDAAGILAGDLGLVTAMRAFGSIEAPRRVVDRLLDLVESTVHASAAGELADVRLQVDLPQLSSPMREALTVAELKTAVYSFQLPMHAGALLAEAPEPVVTAMDEIGALLGIGFQLFDDLLGVFGAEQRTGKSVLGDLREGKRTVLLAHAASTGAWPQLRPLLGRADLDTQGAARARELLGACGSRRWTEDLARWHLRSALDVAERHDLPEPLMRELRAATDTVLRAADHALAAAPSARDSAAPASSGLPV